MIVENVKQTEGVEVSVDIDKVRNTVDILWKL